MNETWWVDINQLDDEQKAVLTATADSSILILGPPGSGKTNILMLRANYVRPVGPRQLFISFTRSLAEHLKSGSNVGRLDRIQPEEIMTFMSWARSVIRNYNGKLPEESGDFEAVRRETLAALEDTINDAELGELYDVVFVDEVQDFWEAELLVLRKLAARLNFAGDSRQRIWKRHEGLQTASEMVDEPIRLTRHYRIGEKICEYADQIYPPKAGQAPLIEGCNYNEALRPSSVETIACSDAKQVYTKCILKIKEQLRYITDEPIGVIGPFNDTLDEFMAIAESDSELAPLVVRQRSDDYHAYDDNSRIRVMTVHSAKGSEFRAVHLFGGEAFKNNNRELAFTAVTRAKTEVAVYHTRPLLGHMQPATGSLTTDLSSLF